MTERPEDAPEMPDEGQEEVPEGAEDVPEAPEEPTQLPEGARIIATDSFLRTNQAVHDIADHSWIGVVYGSAGRGKSFAVSQALDELDLLVSRIDMPETATPLLVLKILFDALTGLPPKGDRFALQRDLREILSEEARVILLDEAQALTKNSIEEVRRLHDHRTTRFGLVLCGGNGTKETLARFKMLGSRTKRWVEFDEMSFEEVLQVIPRYHPLFEKTAPEVLKEIYDRFAKGMWRNWASFLADAIESAREHGADTVDERIMRDVFERRKGGRDGGA